MHNSFDVYNRTSVRYVKFGPIYNLMNYLVASTNTTIVPLGDCIFGYLIWDDFLEAPLLNLSLYLSYITLCYAFLTLGKAIEGTRLKTVYIITALLIVQKFSEIILSSVFNCY